MRLLHSSRTTHLRSDLRALGVVLVLATLAACGEPGPVEHSISGEAMGTTYSVKLRVESPLDSSAAASAANAVAGEIGSVNEKMSTYLNSSELSRLNQLPGPGGVKMSPETMEVFLEAKRIGELTGGVFDVTVGPLVNAWGFGPQDRRADLSDEEIAELQALTGWDRIEIDEAASEIRKDRAGVYCDLSAIAKGYAVDRVSEALTELGYSDHMVELGGEIRVRGVNVAGEPWRIAVEKPSPEGGRAIQRVLPLRDFSMATSGDYRNYFEKDGRRYSHEIDPRTGRPIEHQTASVSVIHPSCATADAWATALIVLGEQEGFAKAVEQDLAAVFLIRDGEGFLEKTTPVFDRLFP